MNRRYIDEDDDIDEIPRDREISLGATTILGMFFLLALVCAVFFGVGYNMGRKSSVAATAPSGTDSVEASTIKPTGTEKPTAAMTDAPEPADDAPVVNRSKQIPQPEEKAAEKTRVVAEIRPVEKPVAVKTPAVHEAPVPAPVPVGPSSTDVPSIVQVAAVSHQEDADMLVNALKRRGYHVAVHHEPQDKLLHVQIGPLASRKEADAMKQRLLGDGYKAIVK